MGMEAQEQMAANIMAAIGKGDRKAFERLFRECYVSLCVYAESVLHDRDAAEDLVQNTFCQLWEKRNALCIQGSVKTYLYRSVYNAALNALKHEKVKLAFGDFQQKYAELHENNIEDFFDRENQQMLMQEVNRAIDTLPEQCREIFILSRFDGEKNAEIADILQISVRTVETQLYRAMKRLREELHHLKHAEILFFILFSQKL